MKVEFVPVKGQKFEIGRTINPFKCDCEKCDFMNCPKHNYAVKMTQKKYPITTFWDEWKDKILELNKPKRWQYRFHGRYFFRLTYDMLNDLFDFLCFTFPKGTYWRLDSPQTFDDEIGERIYNEISLVKFSRSGHEVSLGFIEIARPYIADYDLNERQYKLAEKIRDSILWLKEKMFEHYETIDKEHKIGWLSPEGRHYPCSHCEHITLAQHLGSGEIRLEADGWVKVALEQEDGYFCNRRMLTAEQRNWLSLNGYVLKD